MGTGYDLHRLEEGRALILGGVSIPFDRGLAGHSDADVLLHALTDAILGAAALGNIGLLYPDTDPTFKDADSGELLRDALSKVHENGYEIANVDSTIIAQAPKLNPHLEAMQKSVAELLRIEIDAVSIKPKTNEGVGPEGRGEAIAAHAVALLRRRES